MIKKYEFWNPRLFELPYYIYLGWLCLINGLGIRTLAKANYALDHGELSLGSKLDTQMAFDQHFFLPTELILGEWDLKQKKQQILKFVDTQGYPVILKSNMGCVGKGVVKVSSLEEVDRNVPLLIGDYLLQKFTPLPYECGVFYIRHQGKPRITGINQKHFPTVTGNGRDDVLTLAMQHERYSAHWDSFLQDLDTSEVLTEGEEKRLSFIGSHTLGCKFTDDRHLCTPELEQAIFSTFASQPGFNFGRVDVKAASEEAFRNGDIVIIEVNGVASLPTHMFDPSLSVWQAYGIFFEHARYLVSIAREQRNQPMDLMPYREIIKRVRSNARELNRVHQKLMGK